MTWSLTYDVGEFLTAAGDFLRARPAENTLLLTVSDSIRDVGPSAFGETGPRFGWWTSDDGVIRSAFLQTPPYPLVLGALPVEAASSLAELLDRPDRTPSRINAPADAGEVFAAAWRARTGLTTTVADSLRLYRLVDLVTPDVPGRARIAGAADRGLLITWWTDFHTAIGEVANKPGDAVDDKLSFGGLTLWEVDGVPVAMAGRSRLSAGMVRVMGVWTPPQFRRHGYAAGATAAVSRATLDAGADEVVLFTDVANATSNALYQRLGYRPVQDRIVLSLTS